MSPDHSEDTHSDRDSEISYERVSSEDSMLTDSDGNEKTSPKSRSSATVTLVRRVRNVGSWTVPALMLGTYIAAVAFIIAHHVLLLVLDGKGVEDFVIPQTWVRDIGNAVARIVQVLLETSVGVALTQSIWFYVRRSSVTMTELDDLFSLPSTTSVPFVALRFSALYVLPVAINLQAFSLVGVFAPNALSIVPAQPISSSLTVPFPNLNEITVANSAMSLSFAPGADGADRFYMGPSTGFRTLVQSVLSRGDVLPWTIPSGCGLACSYNVIYNAPSLRCRDLDPSSIAPTVYIGDEANTYHSDPVISMDTSASYNATSSLGHFGSTKSVQKPRYMITPTANSYDLTLAYMSSPIYQYSTADMVANETRHGSHCVFFNATYDAFVRFANGSQTVDARVVEYGKPYQRLGKAVESMVDPEIIYALFDPKNLVDFAALGLMDGMTRYLVGSVEMLISDGVTTVNTQILDGAALFTVLVDDSTFRMFPTGGRNISQTLEQLCTNLTASLMSDTANLGIRRQVSATVLPDKTIYAYQPSRLWLVYGIALGVALLADLFGLACMRSNGVAMQRSFSSIAASMRAPELNELLNGPDEPPRAAARVVKLRYSVGGGELGERSGFGIVDGSGDEVKMGEVEALNGRKRA